MTRLTGEQFQALTMAVCRPADKHAPKSDTTITGRLVIVVMGRKGMMPISASVRNVTPTTIDLEMPQSLSVGTKLFVYPKYAAGKTDRAIVCVVARWFPVSMNCCFISAHFESEIASPVSQSEIQQSIDAEELRQFADSGG